MDKTDEKSGGSGGSKGPPKAANALPLVQEWFTFEMLRDPALMKEKGIPFAERELYMADDEFVKLFGIDKERFQKLPKWKQKQKKQQVGLF